MPLPEDESKRRLKRILILLLPATSWVCFWLPLLPFWHVPPFLIVGVAMVWYIVSQILPALPKTAAPNGEHAQTG
jgi:fatty acid desaturase